MNSVPKLSSNIKCKCTLIYILIECLDNLSEVRKDREREVRDEVWIYKEIQWEKFRREREREREGDRRVK